MAMRQWSAVIAAYEQVRRARGLPESDFGHMRAWELLQGAEPANEAEWAAHRVLFPSPTAKLAAALNDGRVTPPRPPTDTPGSEDGPAPDLESVRVTLRLELAERVAGGKTAGADDNFRRWMCGLAPSPVILRNGEKP